MTFLFYLFYVCACLNSLHLELFSFSSSCSTRPRLKDLGQLAVHKDGVLPLYLCLPTWLLIHCLRLVVPLAPPPPSLAPPPPLVPLFYSLCLSLPCPLYTLFQVLYVSHLSPSSSSLVLSTSRVASRSRLVVDPVWRLIDEQDFITLFGRLTEEAHQCGFVGLDLEWTTVELTPEEPTEGVAKESKRVRPRRVEGPIATVQLTSLSTTVIVRYCDLVGLHQGTLLDPLLPHSKNWPHHRVGARGNSAALVGRVLSAVNALLADATVAKVGVGIFGDKSKMESDYKAIAATLEGCVNLVVLSGHYLASQEVRPFGEEADAVPVASVRSLKAMCRAFAGRTLDKDHFVVCSAWGSGLGALSPLQIQYAAADSEASFDVCAGILSMAGLVTLDASTAVLPACLPYLAPLIGEAVPHHQPSPQQGRRRAAQLATPPTPATATAAGEDWCKGRDKPYYDNINVFDPDMNLVFTVDKSKAEWYVHKKKLATVVEWRTADATSTLAEDGAPSEENREIASIKLCFAPDFRKYNDAHIRRNMDYFKQPKENICVICGRGGKLVRFAVVPLMYRKYFPSVYMSHNSYDLLLLCTGCFARSRSVYAAEKAAVADDFGIPIGHLTTRTAPLYDARIDAKEASLQADTAHFDREEAKGSGQDLVAHHLPPQQILDAMREYRALEQHRECIIAIFKYAKALRQHYASDQERALCYDDAMTPVVAAPAFSRRYCGRRPRKQGTGTSAARADGTQIPEARFKELCAYVDAHAPVYPFYDAAASSQAEQDALFAEKTPSSVEGIELIMTGSCRRFARRSPTCTGSTPDTMDSDDTRPSPTHTAEADDGAAVVTTTERSYHSVLTQYWLSEHPELLGLLPRTTREEERKQDQHAQEDDDDSDPDRMPYVDNHGFLVVKMLMQKYKDEPPSSGKNSEHAVGQFIYRWRTAFLSSLQPQHLPLGWIAEDGILR